MLLGTGSLLCGCAAGHKDSYGQEPGEKPRPLVVTTIFPYYDFVRAIAGDKVDLRLLVGAGKDSHSFEPTPADVILMQNADLLVMNGGSMENWVTEVLESLDEEGPDHVLTMMDYVSLYEEELVEGMEEEEHDHEHEGHVYEGHVHEDHEDEEHDHEYEELEHEDHEHGDHEHGDMKDDEDVEYDEHIWTSPVNAIAICIEIFEELSVVCPAEREFFEANTHAYQEKLSAIDGEFREIVANKKRNLLVFGDKFPLRYFFETYGLDYRAAFSGCSSDTEPGAKTIAYLIGIIQEEEIPAVYHLELSSTRVCDIIREETGAEVLTFETCHNLTRKQFDSGVTYLDLMQRNVEALRKGLQ